ncbi:MAG: trypsin-like peptidase domain-containing protein [Butyrivibrio sp.]|nr:trypsin-like peptidase domain-containing protein [Butyrivibrio sp.]
MWSYRYNIMQLNTPETFVGVRGGLRGDVRDVYFVRALGTVVDYPARIYAIDKRMDTETVTGRTKYIRRKGLPSITNATSDLKHWAELYDKWKADNNTVLFNSISESINFEKCATEALKHVTELFRSSGSNRSDSIVRNYASKILFWTAEIMQKKNIGNWEEHANIKIILEDIKKEQEYLFCYFLTRIGADVMLLLPISDLDLNPQIMNLSSTFTVGPFGLCELNPYTPTQVTSSGQKKQKKTTSDSQQTAITPTVKIPRHEARHTNKIAPSNQSSTREKSFEELARLASSIVMIAVHDQNGDVDGTGSGIMIGEAGYIITNFHVIRGGAFFSVRIEDDENIYTTNEVIKYNSSFDLAVIRINHRLCPLPIYNGREKLVRGQKVVAIGSPLGLFNSVSDGIISGIRNIKDIEMIQFTAPTSPGSSGGAILNMQGEVIGISTAGLDNGQNINLAVPYDTIRLMANGFF